MASVRTINLRRKHGQDLTEIPLSGNLLNGRDKEEEFSSGTSILVSFVVRVTHVTLTTSFLSTILVGNK
jgi:hypothetical protein